MNLSDSACRIAETTYQEVLVELILSEGTGGFKRVGHQRRALQSALDAASPIIAAQALRDAAAYVNANIKAGADSPVPPDETAAWLQARAAQIEETS